jgi:hypothetical protein
VINRSKTGDAPKMPVTVQGRRFVRDSGCGNHLGQRSCANATKGRPLPVILELRDAMNAVDGATIEPRIRICQPDEGSERCKAPSDISKNAPSLQGIGHAGVARSRRRGVTVASDSDGAAPDFQ